MSGFGRGLPRLPPEYPLNGLRVPWLDAEPPQQTAHGPRRIESRDDGVLLEVTRTRQWKVVARQLMVSLFMGVQ